MASPSPADRARLRANAWGLVLAFAFVALCKWPTLHQPPVWDTAMGVFPPAVYLFRSGFDLSALLAQPGWMDAGPNVHSMSLWTWWVALTMRLFGSAGATFVALHLCTWLLTATAGVALYRLARLLLPPALALLTCLLSFFLPVVFVQAGYLYLEIPTLLCTLLAVLAWSRGSFWQAVLWCVVGALVKPTMLATIGALVAGGLLVRLPPGTKLRLLGAMLVAAALPIVAPHLLSGPTGDPWAMPYGAFLFDLFRHKLPTVPDVFALLLSAPLLAALRWPRLWSGIRRRAPGEEETSADRARLVLPLVGTMFLLAMVAMPLAGSPMPFLPRYAVFAVPLCALALVDFGWARLPRRAVVAAGVAAICLCVLNLDGRFYRADFSSFAVVERSMQYRHYLQTQQMGLRALAAKPTDVPAWFCRADAFMAADPMLGYVDGPIANTQNVLALPFSRWHLADYPPHFFLLQTNPWHGGEQIQRTLQEALADPAWQVKSQVFRSHGFRSALHELKRRR